MGLKFFHLPPHRKFNYIPRTYDPIKEELEKGLDKENKSAESEREYTGYHNRIKGSIKRHSITQLKETGYSRLTRLLIILVTFVLLFVIMILLLKYFGLLWTLTK